MQEPRDDDEWRKAITSLLLRGSSLIVIDNVDHTLHSGRLSSALTLDTWGDRHLTVRRALMTAAATVPWVVAVSILRAS